MRDMRGFHFNPGRMSCHSMIALRYYYSFLDIVMAYQAVVWSNGRGRQVSVNFDTINPINA